MKNHLQKQSPHTDPLWIQQSYSSRIQGFQNLMQQRIRDVLIVASLYDLYIFEEDGRLYEQIQEQYQGLNLTHSPEITRVSKGKDALTLLKEDRRFDLIITTLHIEDMRVSEFAQQVRDAEIDIPMVLLAFDNREITDVLSIVPNDLFDQAFIWQGDYRLIMAIIKYLEDKMNVDHDTELVGVQSIIVVEDNILYYSSFLPFIYTEVMRHSFGLITEGINLSHKQLRMRARPKILLCTDYEEAWDYFEKYHDNILGIISDIDFPKKGGEDSQAGLFLAEQVKKRHADIPILLHSNVPENEKAANDLGTQFVIKNSPTLLHVLKKFMATQLSFGDFIFRTPNGDIDGTAEDLLSFEKLLKTVSIASIIYHSERNHFSNWLKARTEFDLAHQLRSRQISDYGGAEETRESLIQALCDYRKKRYRGIVTDFNKEFFDPLSSISRIGDGSLGGKARGLSFVNLVLNKSKFKKFPDVQVYIPAAIVIATDIFDEFLEKNDLHTFALDSDNDEEIMQKFLSATYFSENVKNNLRDFLDLVQTPLAVRSSSLLEDSHNQPFAGVYKTYMLPNSNKDSTVRLEKLCDAIKRVYASTFLQGAKNYIKPTSFRLEEEKMAVIVQKMVGLIYDDRFYPSFSGVARSHNFYPVKPQTAADGTVSVALGLGKIVVEGGASARFCPKYPKLLNYLDNIKTAFQNTQKSFYALDMSHHQNDSDYPADSSIKKYPLGTAEKDGTLNFLASTFSQENNAIYDGTARPGLRLVTFAPLLKHNLFPLAEIAQELLAQARAGTGTPVEIEFAVNLNTSADEPKEFGILQMRPMASNREVELLDIKDFPAARLLCKSDQVLGNGIQKVNDVILVDRDQFDRSQSRNVAEDINKFNAALLKEERPYALIGVGRWGSLDPWLGIPVTWDQISGVRAIVETDFKDFCVTPSQGSHFFQNLTSFLVGYFTIHANETSFLDWEWLLAREPIAEMGVVRHLRFDKPLIIRMNGHNSYGVILKPEELDA